MKTKHILTAIALPALLAACSQDTEWSEAINQKDFSNIPTVDVEFGAAIDANTRMATKFGWEVGDKIGLAWLGDGDVVTGNTTGKAYQNNPLFCTNASTAAFKTETMLYIGKYFAYMPYNPGEMTVENIEFTTEGQVLTTNANDLAKKAIYISPKKVTLSNKEEVPAGEQAAGMGKNIQLNLSRLSNAATLDLTFKNVATLADLKILGIAIDVQKVVKTEADPDEATSAVPSSSQVDKLLPVSFKYNPQENASVTDWSSLAVDAVRTFFTTGGSLSAAADKGAISVTSETGLALPADGKLKTYALTLPAVEEVPATDPEPQKDGTGVTAAVKTTTYNLVITVTTNYGTIAAKNIKVAGGSWRTSDLFTKFGQSGTITADVDADDMTFPATTVKTQAELNSVLAAAAAAGYEDAIEITINPATKIANSGAFELKDFTMPEGLKAPITLVAGENANAKLNFTGSSTINKQLTVKTGTVVSVSGTLNVKNIVNSSNTQQVTLAAADGITIAKGGGVLNNEGKIDANITTEAGTASPAKAAGLYVSAGEKACLETGKAITNNGAVQWKAGTVPTATTGLVYAEVKDFSGLKAAAVATSCVTTARFMNEVTFNNAYTDITIPQIKTIEVYAPVTINFYENAVNEAQTIEFSALTALNIEKNGKLAIVSDNKDNELKAATGCTTTLKAGSELSFKLLKMTNFANLTYAGKVTLEDVTNGFSGTSTKQEGGSMSVINN